MFLEAFDSSEIQVYRLSGSRIKVIDHLSLMLGSRRTLFEPPESLQATSHSIIFWGVPCLRQGCIKGDPAATCDMLQDLISTFEPRLDQVSVDLAPTTMGERSSRHYQITGVYMGEQQAEDLNMTTRIVEFGGRLVVETLPDE